MSIGYQSAAILERNGMAKAKKRKPDPADQKTLIALKGNPDWLEWLKRYADSLGVPLTTSIDIALREQAKRDGFIEPMPKRLVR
jgi:hypothetical protein